MLAGMAEVQSQPLFFPQRLRFGLALLELMNYGPSIPQMGCCCYRVCSCNFQSSPPKLWSWFPQLSVVPCKTKTVRSLFGLVVGCFLAIVSATLACVLVSLSPCPWVVLLQCWTWSISGPLSPRQIIIVFLQDSTSQARVSRGCLGSRGFHWHASDPTGDGWGQKTAKIRIFINIMFLNRF